MRRCIIFFTALAASLCGASAALGQASSLPQPRARIAKLVDESSTVRVPGNTHPLVASSSSEAVDESTPMEHMILYLKGDPSQEAQLAELIAAQNNPKSPEYHHFLSPAEFGSQYGVAKADLDKVTAWLSNHGLHVDEVLAGQRAIVFSGAAGNVASAFKTEIRRYNTGNQKHFANASDPQIPSALTDVVGGVVKMHDFRHGHSLSKPTPLSAAQFADPKFDAGGGHYLAPADYASIYNINPVYSAGINGTGQTIAVIARSNISVQDVQSFRSTFGLPSNNPQVVIVNHDPGIISGDSTETTLDTEWSGAVARNATVKVVVAASTNTSDGIDLSAAYAVNNNVASVVSLSYGSCEAAMGSSELAFYNSLWQQAAAQGMSVMVSSGDSGAAGCSGGSSSTGSGKAVNGLCSSPYATCVGGTEFVEGTNPGQYWLPGNNSVYGSAVGYIPEAVWNESGSANGSGLWAGGGGASTVYSKPSWQTGPGVPADGHRDLPDVSLTAAGHDGYVILQSGGLMSIGGTSASAPSFAGLMALVNQKANARQGLANTVLYPLASKQVTGGAAVFHDITSGNNSVPGVGGYAAATAYDLASGLGSVDANMLVNHWADGAKGAQPSLSLSASSNSLTVKIGQSIQTTVTSTAANLNAAVTLAVSGAPAGVTATLGSLTIASPGSGSVAVTVAASTSAKPGTYALSVTAKSGTTSATLPISITIPTPTFTLSTSATSATGYLGSTTQLSITSTPQNGFSSSVALAVTGLPAGVSAAFAPPTLTGANPASSTLTLSLASSAKSGSYPLTITATGGGITQVSSISLTVAIPGICTLAANPTSVAFVAGQSAVLQVSCGSAQGVFAGPLLLSVTGAPSGVTPQLATTSLVAGSSTTLNLTSSKATAAGKYSLSLMATSGSFTRSLAIPVTISAANTFSLTASQSVVTAKAGTAVQLTLTTAHVGIFNSAISLVSSGLPTGVAASFSKSTLAAPGDGNVTVTLSAGSTAKPGTYSVLFTGTGGGITQTVSLTFTISAAMDFSFALSTSSMTIQQSGAPGTVIVSTGNFTGGFNSTITITFAGLAPGMNYGATGATTGNNLVNVSIGLTAASYTPVGVYPVTITASGAGIVHSSIVQVTVTKAGAATH